MSPTTISHATPPSLESTTAIDHHVPQPLPPTVPLEEWSSALIKATWQGHTFSPSLDDNQTRISFTNVHGIRTKGASLHESISDLLTAHQLFNIDLFGISEHHLPLSDPSFPHRLYRTMQQNSASQPVTYQLNSSRESSGGSGRLMGGTGLVATGCVVGRLEPCGKGGDTMGRWSYCHFRRNRAPPLTVISIYQVCPTTTNAIGHTAWHQQRRALDLANRHIHPRKAFMQDLEKVIQDLQSKDHAIIIGGDWN